MHAILNLPSLPQVGGGARPSVPPARKFRQLHPHRPSSTTRRGLFRPAARSSSRRRAVEDLRGKVLARVKSFPETTRTSRTVASAIAAASGSTRRSRRRADGASSAAALAVQDIARELKKIFLISGAGPATLPQGLLADRIPVRLRHLRLSNSTATAMVRQGSNPGSS